MLTCIPSNHKRNVCCPNFKFFVYEESSMGVFLRLLRESTFTLERLGCVCVWPGAFTPTHANCGSPLTPQGEGHSSHRTSLGQIFFRSTLIFESSWNKTSSPDCCTHRPSTAMDDRADAGQRRLALLRLTASRIDDIGDLHGPISRPITAQLQSLQIATTFCNRCVANQLLTARHTRARKDDKLQCLLRENLPTSGRSASAAYKPYIIRVISLIFPPLPCRSRTTHMFGGSDTMDVVLCDRSGAEQQALPQPAVKRPKQGKRVMLEFPELATRTSTRNK